MNAPHGPLGFSRITGLSKWAGPNIAKIPMGTLNCIYFFKQKIENIHHIVDNKTHGCSPRPIFTTVFAQ